MNDTLKWIALGVVGYLLYTEFTAGDLAASMTTAPGAGAGAGSGTGSSTGSGAGAGAGAGSGTTTTPPPPAAQVTLISAVSKVANNALQATFNINGTVETIAVIPGGDAYNTAGHGITAALAAVGVTPAQLYSIMSAQLAAPGSTPITSGAGHRSTAGVRGLNALANGPLVHMRSDGTGKWVM